MTGFSARPLFDWKLRTRTLKLGRRTLLMGIVNVTPDSFSDGGQFFDASDAGDHALRLLDDGVDIVDLGGESTRPGATPISAEEEQQRVLPVLEGILLLRPGSIVSVDTYHASTALRALEYGAEIINDVSGLTWDEEMAAVLARERCGAVLMHTRGRPQEWKSMTPLASDEVLPLVRAGLEQTLEQARQARIEMDRIVLDPGFGFGKLGDENFALHAGLATLHTLGRPLLAGSSRKRFLTAHFIAPTEDARDHATSASNVAAILAGAHLLRVHDVAQARAALGVADRILHQQGRVATDDDFPDSA